MAKQLRTTGDLTATNQPEDSANGQGDVVPPADAKSDGSALPAPAPAAPAAGTPAATKAVPAPPPPIVELWNGLSAADFDAAKAQRHNAVKRMLQDTIKSHPVASNYNVIILYDHGTMLRGDADKIYRALSDLKDQKPILLVLYSTGGSIASAYLIGKLCQENAKDRFVVAVPRLAKSAATLICCGADEIHMGSLSELGPIDPQIDDLPALGLKNAVEHLAELVKKYPGSSDMFSAYLTQSLKLIHLGFYERVVESAAQYAERLLNRQKAKLSRTPKSLAEHLVYSYMDHGFVIDKTESLELFGPQIIKHNSDEYKLSNDIYERMNLIYDVCKMNDCTFYFIGSPENAASIEIGKARRPTPSSP